MHDPYDYVALYPYVVTSPLGKRTYQAEDQTHAIEQHVDGFPDEPILHVHMDVDALPDADDEVTVTLRVADAEILRMLIDDATAMLDHPFGIAPLDSRITEAHLNRIDTAVASAMIDHDE